MKQLVFFNFYGATNTLALININLQNYQISLQIFYLDFKWYHHIMLNLYFKLQAYLINDKFKTLV
jgi:hypothetical protein